MLTPTRRGFFGVLAGVVVGAKLAPAVVQAAPAPRPAPTGPAIPPQEWALEFHLHERGHVIARVERHAIPPPVYVMPVQVGRNTVVRDAWSPSAPQRYETWEFERVSLIHVEGGRSRAIYRRGVALGVGAAQWEMHRLADDMPLPAGVTLHTLDLDRDGRRFLAQLRHDGRVGVGGPGARIHTVECPTTRAALLDRLVMMTGGQ